AGASGFFLGFLELRTGPSGRASTYFSGVSIAVSEVRAETCTGPGPRALSGLVLLQQGQRMKHRFRAFFLAGLLAGTAGAAQAQCTEQTRVRLSFDDARGDLLRAAAIRGAL